MTRTINSPTNERITTRTDSITLCVQHTLVRTQTIFCFCHFQIKTIELRVNTSANNIEFGVGKYYYRMILF